MGWENGKLMLILMMVSRTDGNAMKLGDAFEQHVTCDYSASLVEYSIGIRRVSSISKISVIFHIPRFLQPTGQQYDRTKGSSSSEQVQMLNPQFEVVQYHSQLSIISPI